MKLNSEECDAVLSSGVHHVSPPSRPRSKSDLVEMDSTYSPSRKASKSEPKSRVHGIPVLMVLVFFVLWAASSEVKSDVRKVATIKLDKSQVHLKVINNEIALPGSRTVLFQDESSHVKQTDPSNRNKAQDIGLLPKPYMRGNAGA